MNIPYGIEPRVHMEDGIKKGESLPSFLSDSVSSPHTHIEKSLIKKRTESERLTAQHKKSVPACTLSYDEV